MKFLISTAVAALAATGAAWAQAPEPASPEGFPELGTTWNETTVIAFFEQDGDTFRLRDQADIEANWQSLPDEARAVVRADCALITTDAADAAGGQAGPAGEGGAAAPAGAAAGDADAGAGMAAGAGPGAAGDASPAGDAAGNMAAPGAAPEASEIAQDAAEIADDLDMGGLLNAEAVSQETWVELCWTIDQL